MGRVLNGAIGPSLDELRAKRDGLDRLQSEDQREEQRQREEAVALRWHAGELDESADDLAERQRVRTQEIAELDRQILAAEHEAQIAAEEAELEAQIRELQTRKAALRQGTPPS